MSNTSNKMQLHDFWNKAWGHKNNTAVKQIKGTFQKHNSLQEADSVQKIVANDNEHSKD